MLSIRASIINQSSPIEFSSASLVVRVVKRQFYVYLGSWYVLYHMRGQNTETSEQNTEISEQNTASLLYIQVLSILQAYPEVNASKRHDRPISNFLHNPELLTRNDHFYPPTHLPTLQSWQNELAYVDRHRIVMVYQS